MPTAHQDLVASPARSQSSTSRHQAPLLLRADATPDMGVGHAMRLLALGQEALSRGHAVVISGDLSIPWVRQAYREAGIELVPATHNPADLLTLANNLSPSAVLLDGYHLESEYGNALRSGGHRVGAMVDGPFGADQEADVYIDQNPGATPRPTRPPQKALAGANFTLFRDDVLAARDARQTKKAGKKPDLLRVLAVFGGTDPMGAAPVIAPLIAHAATRSNAPLALSVVSQDVGLAPTLHKILPPGSTCDVIPAVTDLARRAGKSDLVVTASGSTVWELLCIAVPTSVVCVVDNQKPGYEFATEAGYVAGVGELEHLRTDQAAREKAILTLNDALTNSSARARRSAAGAALLDGHGRARVLDALLPPVSPTE